MESKFTKGPWKAAGVSMTGKSAYKVIGTALGGKYKIAHCFFHYDETLPKEFNIREKEEAEANSKLIAAAPDMLEALQAAKTELEMYIPVTDVKVLQQIQAAIDKALD